MVERKVLALRIEAITRQGLARVLRARGYDLVSVDSTREAFDVLAENDFSLTLVDLNGGTEDVELLRELKRSGRNAGPLVVITDRRNPSLDGVSLPVHTVLWKPLDLDELQHAVDTLLVAPLEELKTAPEPMVGRIRREVDLWCSPKMQDARQILREAARVDVTVLITGETGTGKELVAHAIHHFSARRPGPFVKVNCAAMPRELLESELFGHERGAFTGAHKLKIGKFEAAHRGTIFLDEIGDLHPALQAKLLHVLQDGEFSRIGGKSTLSVDVRILAATNQNLERAVAEGRFREDLYYRLNVVHIEIPPLRERAAEIPQLANYFVERYAKLYRREGFTVPPSVMDRLIHHPFPGNVRELENLIKRMIVLDDAFLTRIPLGDSTTNGVHPAAPSSPAPEPSLKEIGRRAALAAEREAIARALEQTGWNRVRAARVLRISYRALLYKIKLAGLDSERSLARSASERIQP